MDYGYESTDDDDYLPDFLRAEYQPDQTLSDYSPEQLTESSAIEGYQPLKYSVVGNRAEALKPILKKKPDSRNMRKPMERKGRKSETAYSSAFLLRLKTEQKRVNGLLGKPNH